MKMIITGNVESLVLKCFQDTKKFFESPVRALLYNKNSSSLFIYPTNARLDCSKIMLKFTLIFTLKVLLHVSV